MNRLIRILVLLAALVMFAFATVATATTSAKTPAEKTLPALHSGSHGARVRDAQWLEHGHNVFHIRTYAGRIDGKYGHATAKATRKMKYRLGYSPRALNGRFGHKLYTYLVGRSHLPHPYQVRKHRRWLALLREREGARLGVVALVGACRDAPPRPYVLVYARRVAAVYGRPLVCVSGTRHTLVVGTTHWSMHNWGAAADLATPNESMNIAVGQAALIAAGMPSARAHRTFGPTAYGFWYGGVNILFQTIVGGNHHNHVHVGLWCWPHAERCRFTGRPN